MESEPDSTSEITNAPASDSSQQDALESRAAGEGDMTMAAETAAASSDDRTGSKRISRNEDDNAAEEAAGAAAAAEHAEQGDTDAGQGPTQLAAADRAASGEVEHVVQDPTEGQSSQESHDSAAPAVPAAVAEHEDDKQAAPEDSAPVTASAADSTQSNSSAAGEASKTPAEVPQTPTTSSKTATQPTAPLPAPTEPRDAADEDVHKSSKGSATHKETAVERLTTPTAMRMLKQLEQTQGGKQEWHIATGVPFKSKKLSADEMSQMVDRLCTPKHEADNLPPKPHAVKLVFEGNKETLVPVKETSKEDNISYMANLYARCQETRAKTMQTLQEKWLQPLIKPKQAAK